MIEKQIEIATADGVSDAIVYRPDGDDKWLGVIHLTDIGGIRPAHCDIARRLAGEGYVVLVPNVFYRTARPPVFPRGPDVTDEQRMKRFSELAAPLTPDAIERDAQPFVDALMSQKHLSQRSGFGVAGYCFTGAVAMRFAATCPDRIASAASFHGGGLFTDSATSPHLVLSRIKARLYFAHAVKDRSMPEEAIRNFESALEDWGGQYESETYEGAYHSWTSSDSPVYNQPQAGTRVPETRLAFASDARPSRELDSRRPGLDRVHGRKRPAGEQCLRLRLKQRPKPVYAEHGSKRDVQQIERGQDNCRNPCPGTELYQPDSDDDPGNRKDQDDRCDADPKHAQKRRRGSDVGIRVLKR
jgi:carboxymethylenebutenolidase